MSPALTWLISRQMPGSDLTGKTMQVFLCFCVWACYASLQLVSNIERTFFRTRWNFSHLRGWLAYSDRRRCYENVCAVQINLFTCSQSLFKSITFYGSEWQCKEALILNRSKTYHLLLPRNTSSKCIHMDCERTAISKQLDAFLILYFFLWKVRADVNIGARI